MIDLRVLTIGTFDLFHRGHYNLLCHAEALGEVLYVGVNSDNFVEKYKGKRPTEDQDRRLRRVRECPAVDAAVINTGPGYALIREVKPDIIIVGSDWYPGYLDQIHMSESELFDTLGITLVFVPRTPGVSTTALRTDGVAS